MQRCGSQSKVGVARVCSQYFPGFFCKQVGWLIHSSVWKICFVKWLSSISRKSWSKSDLTASHAHWHVHVWIASLYPCQQICFCSWSWSVIDGIYVSPSAQKLFRFPFCFQDQIVNLTLCFPTWNALVREKFPRYWLLLGQPIFWPKN